MVSAPGSDPVVHFVLDPALEAARCLNAIVSDARPSGELRDLTVIRPGGPLVLRGVRCDSDPAEPAPGTWHFRASCPFRLDQRGPDPHPEDQPREETISCEFGTDALTAFREAVQQVNQGLRDVVWVDRDGHVIAAIIPAVEYHPPGTCCCQNCPWGCDHGGR